MAHPLIATYIVSKAAQYGSEFIIDNILRDKIPEPAIGGVVYCDLALGYAEHSGIYIGDGKIIELNGSGDLKVVSHSEFIEGTSGQNIYTCCYNDIPIGSDRIYQRAISFKEKIKTKNYNLVTENCHIFSTSCITGNTENTNTFLWMLKNDCQKYLGSNNWRIWDSPEKKEAKISYEGLINLRKIYSDAAWELSKEMINISSESRNITTKPSLLNLFRSLDTMIENAEDEIKDLDIQLEIREQVIEGLENIITLIDSKLDD